MKLPIRTFAMDADIGRFYFRELEITNFKTLEKIEGNRVTLKSAQFGLNGAPVKASADIDLGVRGYQYDFSMSADRVQLEPLANSFMPEKKGMYKGEILANLQLKGAGTTGPSLKKNLSGQCNFAFTNANIQIVSPRLKGFLTPIALLLNAPDLLDSPLNWVALNSQVGEGKVKANALSLVSPSFAMHTAGEMLISDVLTNSPFQNWPVDFYLRRSLAEKVRMVPANTPTNAAYAKLPNFLKVAGTLGDPKAQIDKTAVAGSIAQKVLERVPGLNEKTGGLLPGILPGNKPATGTFPNVTTNIAPPRLNPFDLIPKPKP